MSAETRRREIEALAHFLDVAGGDPARWREAERARFLPLAATDAEARALLAEAAALDRLLMTASSAALPREDGTSERMSRLEEQLMVAVAATSQNPRAAIAAGPVTSAVSDAAGTVVPMRPRPAPRAAASAMAPVAKTAAPNRRGWTSGALIAASLAAGMLIGAFDLAPLSLEQVFVQLSGSETLQTIAALQTDPLSLVLEEEPL